LGYRKPNYRVGEWVQITYRHKTKEELKKHCTSSISWQLTKGQVLRVAGEHKDPDYIMVQSGAKNIRMPKKWCFPVEESAIERLRKEREVLIRSEGLERRYRRRRDAALATVFEKEKP